MNWPKVQLQAIALHEKGAIVSGPFGSNISAKYFVEEGVPVIRGNNLTKGITKFIDEGFAYLTEAKAAEFRNCIAVTDDIVFTAAGSIGQVGMIPPDSRYEKYVISNKQLRVRLDRSKANPNFVYAWLSSPLMVRYLENMNNGGAVPLLNLGIVRKVPVPLPPIETQNKIADILSAYDGLIENNRRRIALLEEAARLLYREWFVRLRFPGHEHTKIADGVPEGWERTALGNIGQLNYGKALKADNRIDGEFPVYGSSGIVGTHHESYLQGPGIIVGRKGNVGSVYWTYEDFWPIDTVYFFEPSAVTLYVYYTLQNVDFISTDVAVPGLNRNFARSRKVLMPSDQVREAFDGIAVPLHKQISLLQKENESLSRARDLLLPRLMNGEVAV